MSLRSAAVVTAALLLVAALGKKRTPEARAALLRYAEALKACLKDTSRRTDEA